MSHKIYSPMVPPLEIKPFDDMNKKEAQAHFDWYISEIPNRTAILKDMFESERDKREDALDFTAQSLKPLWKWFVPQVKLIARTEEEIECEVAHMHPLLKDTIKPNKYKISTETLCMAFDIGIYFAETFIKNNEGIYWGFFNKPKSRFDVNRPVLLGFENKVDLPPSRILKVLTSKVADGDKNPDALYNMYNVWREKVLKKEQT